MGVQGLWELLAPVGRRVSVETLAGRKLAIDASIWMVQFMKAMRDEKGEMVRNAHLLGFFRRICKLLFLRTKPIFVFDGGTPALKRRTVAARRRHRENARAKIRKTAEKLLLNHFKAKKLEELAEEIKNNSRQKDDPKGKRVVSEDNNDDPCGYSQRGDETTNGASISQEHLDEMLAASLAAEEEGKFIGKQPVSGGELHTEQEVDEDDSEEMAFPVIDGNVDPTVLASLPPSMQLDLLVQMRERLMAENRQRYQKIKKSPSKFSELQIQSYLKTVAFRREIDEVQKCAAGRGPEGVQTSRIASEANREFIFSSSFTGDKKTLTSSRVDKNGNTEPHVMQKETMLSNSTKFHSSTSQLIFASGISAEEPAKDFGHDVETYHDERGCIRVSRVKGLGIHMTRDLQRNLDLIREQEHGDSGQNGDKEMEPICHNEMQGIPESSSENDNPLVDLREKEGHSEAVNRNTATVTQEIQKSHSYQQSTDKSGIPIEISVSADDSGHKDADNDLFLWLAAANSTLKFSSEIIPSEKKSNDPESDYVIDEKVESSKNEDTKESQLPLAKMATSEEDEVDWEEGGVSQEIENSHSYELSTLKSRTPIEISFSADDSEYKGVDDDLFLQLAAGNSTLKFSKIVSSDKNSNDYVSDCVWGERFIEEKVESSKNDKNNESPFCVGERVMSEEEEVEWEEGEFQIALPCQTEHQKAVSRGALEEEADVQEAIRRSLKDSSQVEITRSLFQGPAHEKRGVDSSPVPLESDLQRSPIQHATTYGRELLDSADRNYIPQTVNSSEKQFRSSKLIGYHSEELSVKNEPSGSSKVSCHEHIIKSIADDRIVGESHVDKVPTTELVRLHSTQQEQSPDIYSEGKEKASFGKSTDVSYQASSQICMASTGNTPVIVADAEQKDFKVVHSSSSERMNNNANLDEVSFIEKTEEDIDREHGPDIQKDSGIPPEEHLRYDTLTQGRMDVQIEVSDAMLDKQRLILIQERQDLGEEQRRLERNAESVSSEMFAECQELLQMFGLPFIIAPMEAEAQCAYMELTNLVDGVVTDDSDVFLFGARSVYKNIFDDRKYVETYLMKDIESELGLSREMLIRMALLLGSDYTEGVSGIGIVNAIEVVHAFPEEDGLKKFREWLESPDPSILGKLYPHISNNSKKRLAKVSSTDVDGCRNSTEGSVCDEGNLGGNDDQILDAKRIFMDKHRNISKNWHISSSFPSDSVVSAYTNPQIDDSTESFTWGKPDLPLLRKLCWERFGWINQKVDELLMPVLKEFSKHETQLRLEAFYTFNEKFAKIRSQRIKKAVKGITGNCSTELVDDLVQGDAGLKKKRRVTPPTADESKSGNHSDGKTDSGRKALRRSRSSKSQNMLSDEVQAELFVQNKKSQNVKHMLSANGVRGRGAKESRGKGRGECSFESAETSSSDSGRHSSEEEMQFKMAGTDKLRQSARQRKRVQYAEEENLDADDLPDLPNKRSGICSDEGAAEQELDDNKSNHDVGMDKQMFVLNEIRATPDDTTRDYLLGGGGFCTGDQGASAGPSTALADASVDAQSLGLEVPSRDDGLGTNLEETTQGSSLRFEETGLLTERVGEANSGLSAMTSLRRKRRKL